MIASRRGLKVSNLITRRKEQNVEVDG